MREAQGGLVSAQSSKTLNVAEQLRVDGLRMAMLPSRVLQLALDVRSALLQRGMDVNHRDVASVPGVLLGSHGAVKLVQV